ncbi:AAA family ATPase [Calditrichota bacterium LG25]
MQIKSIPKIKNFGIFNDFEDVNVKEFGKYNIIFGWNYSGKTTFSRIFRCLEKREYHPDYKDGKFKIICENGDEINETNITNHLLKIRVFNSDYIRENLQWEQSSEGIQPILIVGEENIKLQKKLNNLKKEKEKLEKELINNQIKKEEIEIGISSALTKEAARITKELSLGRNFRKPDLEELINNPDVQNWTLAEDIFQKMKITAQSTNKLDEIVKISIMPDNNIIERTRRLLKKCVTPSKTIKRLKDARIENWVREGKELHIGKQKCEFCQNELPPGLLEELDEYFSKEYENFKKEIEDYIEILKNKKIAHDLKNKNDFYQELQYDYVSIRKELESEIQKYNQTIDKLIESLEQKIDKRSEEIELDKIIYLNVDEINEKVAALNELIKKHNEKTKTFDQVKFETIESLKKHYASQFYIENNIADKKEEIETIIEQIENLNEEIQKKVSEIELIEAKISEAVKGAEELNAFIKRYFGQNTPIKIKVINDRFHVFREETKANNLSEGEKTAISFSYFLTRLLDNETKDSLDETIIYIDDPISSLDSNHLYNTYTLIASFLKNKCCQLFISTHNYEFFNLLKDEFFSKRLRCEMDRNSRDCRRAKIYYIERSLNNAIIKNIDCTLCKFKSEYQYIFYQLYQFRHYSDDDEYKLFTIPNLLRRFLETYITFNYPSGRGFKGDLDKIIKNDEDRKFVHKIADELSHNENIARVLKLYSPEEIKRAIEITLNAFETDPVKKEYLTELKLSVGIFD